MEPTHHNRRRQGTALILVLAMTTLLVTLGIAATKIARAELKKNDLEKDQAQVRIAAQYALDFMQKRLDGETDWRSTANNGAWNVFSTINGVTIYYAYVDQTDGDLSDDATDPFLLHSLAFTGDSLRVYRVELISDEQGNLKRNEATFEQGVFE